MFHLRLAILADIPPLSELIAQSVRGLSAGYYTGPQIEKRAPSTSSARTPNSSRTRPTSLSRTSPGNWSPRAAGVGAGRSTAAIR